MKTVSNLVIWTCYLTGITGMVLLSAIVSSWFAVEALAALYAITD